MPVTGPKEAGLSTALLTLVACGADRDPELVLAGPAEVRASALGPVDAVPVLLDDGTEPDGVIWTVSHPEVADVQGNRVVAVGPGETEVGAEWEGSRITFRVIVALDTQLGFVDAPETLHLGERRPLVVVARVGDDVVDAGPVSWTSSASEIVELEDGTAVGRRPGTAWVTARARGASAMLELEVVP